MDQPTSQRCPYNPPFVLDCPFGCLRAPSGGVADLTVYLHGFRSSSASVKAQKVIASFTDAGYADRLWVPDLPASPLAALTLVRDEINLRIEQNPTLSLALVGSSLGGFLATVLAEQYPEARVVLLNPAVHPWLDLQDQIGRKKVYFSDEEFEFVPDYLHDLQAMSVSTLAHPERYLLVAAQGDEVLSFDTMVQRYAGASQLRIAGSDHALTEFDCYLPFIRLFLGVTS